MRKAGGLALALLAVVTSSTAAARTDADPRFSYDRTRPLGLRLGAEQTVGGVVRQPFTFDAGAGRRNGYWTHPAGTGPWPVVLLSPGSDGDASTQLPDADRLARRGLASLTVAPPSRLVTCRAAADVRSYVSYVVGRRRALDLLPTLPGADTKRVAALGFSFGGAVTATLVGIDRRLRGAVVQSARAHLSTPIGEFCDHLAPAAHKAYLRAYGAVDPVRWVGRGESTPLLFQNGRRDPISPPADVTALVRAAKKPKTLRWYPGGHELNEQARSDAEEWLVRLLSR